MHPNDGKDLQPKDKQWTWMGANSLELLCGFLVFLLISLFVEIGKGKPGMGLMMLGWFSTSWTLAALRRNLKKPGADS